MTLVSFLLAASPCLSWRVTPPRIPICCIWRHEKHRTSPKLIPKLRLVLKFLPPQKKHRMVTDETTAGFRQQETPPPVFNIRSWKGKECWNALSLGADTWMVLSREIASWKWPSVHLSRSIFQMDQQEERTCGTKVLGAVWEWFELNNCCRTHCDVFGFF